MLNDTPLYGEAWESKKTGERVSIVHAGLSDWWRPTVTYKSNATRFLTTPMRDFLSEFKRATVKHGTR